MVEETWDTRELPILRAVYGAREEGADLNAAGKAAVPELDDRRYMHTIEDLFNAGYLDVAKPGRESAHECLDQRHAADGLACGRRVAEWNRR